MTDQGHHGPHELEEELKHDLAFERATLDESITHDYSTADTGIVPLDRRRPMWHFAGLWTTFVAGFSYFFLAFEIHDGGHSLASTIAITLGGTRIYVAGVTECVPEVRALKNIDVAFIPVNIPLGRMTPAAAAECVKAIAPKIVYPYHYDQLLAARLVNPQASAEGPAGGLTIAQSLQAFKDALKGETIEVRDGDWYPKIDVR